MERTTTASTSDAFAERIAANRGIVVKVAGTYARHPDERDDLAQDIVAQLWRAWPRYDASRPFATWMYRIALNVAIGHARSEARRQTHAAPLDATPDEVADDDADPEAARRVRQLRGFIERQPPLDRALLLLYIDGRPQREIAEILGLSETNVATKIGRLKLRIRDEI
jgi:RNA polymerase sigma-70 factor (ECF subfamily)